MSVDGADVTIIDCEDSGYGIRIGAGSDPRTTVRGFTIQNGHGTDGGGIMIDAATATVDRCIIQNCSADNNGGGFWVGRSTETVQVLDCSITGNFATNRGGGFMIERADLLIQSCLISGNTAANDAGGAIYDQNSTLVQVDQCTIVYNTTSFEDEEGFAIQFEGNARITNTVFANNGVNPARSHLLGTEAVTPLVYPPHSLFV